MEAFLPHLNKHFGKRLTIDDIVHYDFADVLQVAREEVDELFSRVGSEGIYRELQLIEGAEEALPLLAANHNIKLITFRQPHLKEDTEHWLRENNIPFDGIIYLGFQDKAQHISECDIFIEDNLDAALKVASKGVDVLLFDYPWNRRTDDYRHTYSNDTFERMHRVYTWSEIMDFITIKETQAPVYCRGGHNND